MMLMTTANILNYRGYTARRRADPRMAIGMRIAMVRVRTPEGRRCQVALAVARRSTPHTYHVHVHDASRTPRRRPPRAALRHQSPDAASASAVSAAATVSREALAEAPADSTRRYLTSPRLSVSVRSYGLDAMADLRGPRTPLSSTARQFVIRPVPHHARVEIHLP